MQTLAPPSSGMDASPGIVPSAVEVAPTSSEALGMPDYIIAEGIKAVEAFASGVIAVEGTAKLAANQAEQALSSLSPEIQEAVLTTNIKSEVDAEGEAVSTSVETSIDAVERVPSAEALGHEINHSVIAVQIAMGAKYYINDTWWHMHVGNHGSASEILQRFDQEYSLFVARIDAAEHEEELAQGGAANEQKLVSEDEVLARQELAQIVAQELAVNEELAEIVAAEEAIVEAERQAVNQATYSLNQAALSEQRRILVDEAIAVMELAYAVDQPQQDEITPQVSSTVAPQQITVTLDESEQVASISNSAGDAPVEEIASATKPQIIETLVLIDEVDSSGGNEPAAYKTAELVEPSIEDVLEWIGLVATALEINSERELDMMLEQATEVGAPGYETEKAIVVYALGELQYERSMVVVDKTVDTVHGSETDNHAQEDEEDYTPAELLSLEALLALRLSAQQKAEQLIEDPSEHTLEEIALLVVSYSKMMEQICSANSKLSESVRTIQVEMLEQIKRVVDAQIEAEATIRGVDTHMLTIYNTHDESVEQK